MSFESYIRTNRVRERPVYVHLHAACLASTNDVLPTLESMSKRHLGTGVITHPAGPTTKTARVLETRPDATPENLLRLSPEPVVDCWSRGCDGTLSMVPTARCKEVPTEPSLEIVSL